LTRALGTYGAPPSISAPPLLRPGRKGLPHGKLHGARPTSMGGSDPPQTPMPQRTTDTTHTTNMPAETSRVPAESKHAGTDAKARVAPWDPAALSVPLSSPHAWRHRSCMGRHGCRRRTSGLGYCSPRNAGPPTLVRRYEHLGPPVRHPGDGSTIRHRRMRQLRAPTPNLLPLGLVLSTGSVAHTCRSGERRVRWYDGGRGGSEGSQIRW
jgi:hypothetical protein